MRMRLSRRALAGMAAVLVAIPLAAQEPVPVAPADPSEILELDESAGDRMTVAVGIGGRGPYRFLVDTGSERTVISRELAQSLGLQPGRSVIVHSMSEASRIETVVIPRLEVGRRSVSGIQAPAVSRHNLGAEGLLGVDSLRSQRVELDFVRRRMTIAPSQSPQAEWRDGAIVVTARRRFGHLMLVDAEFEGERVWVIVDTGAQVTVANNALRRRLERRGRIGPLQPIELVSVTGGVIHADYTVARRIRISDAEILNLPVAFAEVQPFRQLRLTDRPAILLGMDALQMFERASFDFATRRVRLLVPEEAALPVPTEVAAR